MQTDSDRLATQQVQHYPPHLLVFQSLRAQKIDSPTQLLNCQAKSNFQHFLRSSLLYDYQRRKPVTLYSV